MRHKFLVLTVKKLLKSVYIYGSYGKIKTGVSLFWTTRYTDFYLVAKYDINCSVKLQLYLLVEGYYLVLKPEVIYIS